MDIVLMEQSEAETEFFYSQSANAKLTIVVMLVKLLYAHCYRAHGTCHVWTHPTNISAKTISST